MSDPISATPAMPRDIERWRLDRLVPYARNARTHSDEQIAEIAASIIEFGFTNPILVDSDAGVIAGHGRLLAARKLGLAEVPVLVLSHLTPLQRRAYVLADNRLALNAGWNDELLKEELAAIQAEGFDLGVVGFTDSELESLLSEDSPENPQPEAEEEVPEEPVEAVTRPGDIWVIGRHRLICGDCREFATVQQVLGGRPANICITSPPYAAQRAYDPSSGFRPVPPEEYVGWYADVAASIAVVLVEDGSYFLNIKEHADDGERNLYVKDLTIAHRRQWGWRFVDEFCWRKTDDGVPGGWGNRFKNAWEPVFHFSRQQKIKFRPKEVGHWSDNCFDYSPDNPKSTSGSGLLGTGPRGAAADLGKNHDSWQTTRRTTNNMEGRHGGIARPSNVIEVKTESSQGSHSAPFPRALVEFFVKAFSDPGDLVFDPFLGSGTTIAAAHFLDRVGYGVEISPAYCDVILRRVEHLTGIEPALASGEKFSDIAAHRAAIT